MINTQKEEMVIHFSILVWRIPWTKEPGGLQSLGLQRVGLNWVTKHMAQDSTQWEKLETFLLRSGIRQGYSLSWVLTCIQQSIRNFSFSIQTTQRNESNWKERSTVATYK